MGKGAAAAKALSCVVHRAVAACLCMLRRHVPHVPWRRPGCIMHADLLHGCTQDACRPVAWVHTGCMCCMPSSTGVPPRAHGRHSHDGAYFCWRSFSAIGSSRGWSCGPDGSRYFFSSFFFGCNNKPATVRDAAEQAWVTTKGRRLHAYAARRPSHANMVERARPTPGDAGDGGHSSLACSPHLRCWHVVGYWWRCVKVLVLVCKLVRIWAIDLGQERIAPRLKSWPSRRAGSCLCTQVSCLPVVVLPAVSHLYGQV